MFEGETVALKVEVPDPARSVQWRFQGLDLPGETNQSLILRNVQMGQTGMYEAATSVTVASRLSTGTNSIQLKLSSRPRFVGVQWNSGLFSAQLEGISNRFAVIEKSTDLMLWSQVKTQRAGYHALYGARGMVFTNRSQFGLAEFYRIRVKP